MSKTKVLYHDNCPDGFAAAWACWKALGETAEYIPCSYGHAPPDVTNATVYIVDFSFKRPVMLEMAAAANHIHVLDHHLTARDDLADLDAPGMRVTFDMERSGATLAWQHFHGVAPCWLVDYAEDRDLWRHKLPLSREVNAYLQAGPRTFEAYDAAWAAGPERVAGWGVGCLTWMRYYVDSVKKGARRLRFMGHENIPVVNAPYTATSEVVGELAEDALFAVGWHVRGDGQVAYSLRSRGEFNVAELAATLGGGGHVKAAGFQSPWTPEMLATAPMQRAPEADNG